MTKKGGRFTGLEDIVVCPKDHGPLIWLYDHGVVYNPRLGLGYPIRDGIAQLLDSESFAVDAGGTPTSVGSAR